MCVQARLCACMCACVLLICLCTFSAIESYVICIVDAMRDVCSETVSSFFNCFLRFIYVDLAELNDCEIKLDTCEESGRWFITVNIQRPIHRVRVGYP